MIEHPRAVQLYLTVEPVESGMVSSTAGILILRYAEWTSLRQDVGGTRPSSQWWDWIQSRGLILANMINFATNKYLIGNKG